MNYDKHLIKFNQTIVKPFESDEKLKRILFGLNSNFLGYFEWHYDKDIVYINQRFIDAFNLVLTEDISMLEVSQLALDNNSQFKVVIAASQLFNGENKVDIEIPLQLGQELNWYQISMIIEPSEKYIVGFITKINELRLAKENAKGVSHQLDQILESMPLPIYYYDLMGNLLFNNRFHGEDFSRINKLIEQHIHGSMINLDDYEWIQGLETSQYAKHHMIFKVKFKHRNQIKTSMIHRVEIMHNNLIASILYLHEDISDYKSVDNQLNKILKANELIIEIKDIADHVSDLKSMYDFLLSKIHTVIPAAKRASILKIDQNENLYMASDYGFDRSYIESMVLPFKDSYAYMALQNNNTKSVIIDDIQERFGSAHPEININQFGFVMRSNITTPLVIDDKLYGILSVDSDENHVFDDVDLNLLDYLKLQIERAIDKFRKLRRVKRNSIIDPLTGIFNRRHLIELFDQYVEDTNQLHNAFALVIFDLDKLKKVNDSYGHIAGDKIIKQFAFTATKEIRDTDIMARIGGDEFVGIFWDINEEILNKRINRWTELLRLHPVEHEGNHIITKFSYGTSFYPNDGDTFEILLDKADKKMYQQKKLKK